MSTWLMEVSSSRVTRARREARQEELAPKYWLATRAHMDAAQLAVEIGWLTIPPPPTK